jgi:hypothetical protein
MMLDFMKFFIAGGLILFVLLVGVRVMEQFSNDGSVNLPEALYTVRAAAMETKREVATVLDEALEADPEQPVEMDDVLLDIWSDGEINEPKTTEVAVIGWNNWSAQPDSFEGDPVVEVFEEAGITGEAMLEVVESLMESSRKLEVGGE